MREGTVSGLKQLERCGAVGAKAHLRGESAGELLVAEGEAAEARQVQLGGQSARERRAAVDEERVELGEAAQLRGQRACRVGGQNELAQASAKPAPQPSPAPEEAQSPASLASFSLSASVLHFSPCFAGHRGPF